MEDGQRDYARRKALEIFDKWNDITGCFPKFSGYYYEMCSLVQDAADIGSLVALGVDFVIKDGKPIVLWLNMITFVWIATMNLKLKNHTEAKRKWNALNVRVQKLERK